MRKNFLFLNILFVLFCLKGYAYINIHPHRVRLDVQQGINSGEVVLYNKTTKPVRYRFSIENDELDKVITFYPEVITLGSGEEKNIKIKLEESWRGLEPVEHNGKILVEQLRVPSKDSSGQFIKSQGVEVYPKIKIPLKIYLGDKELEMTRNSETSIRNRSDRELDLDIFYEKESAKGKNENLLEFIKSVRVSSDEVLELQDYLKENESLSRIVLYEKLKDIKLNIKSDHLLKE